MASNDDFEEINELELSGEETFERIDINDFAEEKPNTYKPTTPDVVVVLPVHVSKPIVYEIPELVQQQTRNPIVNASESKISNSSIPTTTPIASVVDIKKTVQPPPSTPIILAPIPSLPKAPAPKRYGDAALIPHNLDQTVDIDAIINKSKKNIQTTLNASTQQQQQQQRDIQAVLEQRRNLFQKK